MFNQDGEWGKFSDELTVIGSKCRQDMPFLLSPEGRTRLDELLGALGEADSIADFIPWLKSEMLKCPPLELLWVLHKNRYLKVTTFLHRHPDHSLTIVGTLVKILFDSNDTVEHADSCKDVVVTIFVDLVSSFVNLWDPIDKNLPASCLMNDFIAKVAGRILNDNDFKFNYLDEIILGRRVPPSRLRRFAVHHFKCMIDYRTDAFSAATACSEHTKSWIMKCHPETSQQFYKRLAAIVPKDILFEEFREAIAKNSFNWKFVLILVSAFATSTPENGEVMKSRLDEWFKESLSSRQRNLLLFSLLALRQCCWEGSIRCFPNYPSWFVSLQLKTASAFAFFFGVLTELVPYEPAIHLKIHTNKVPTLPVNCKPILVDYLTLVKTRLADLKQSTDCVGLFNDYHDSDIEGQESDIGRVVSYFRDTKELPRALLEAFVFRRQYYEKVFLPRLLSTGEKEDPDRGQVVRKLNSLGKISAEVFDKWTQR